MRLLDAETLEVVEFMDHQVPEYVILSHTWIAGQEVTLQEMKNKEGTDRSGYNKIRKTCELALQNNLSYAWVDTCCIDKTSSAELSEAINSMMSWYQRSKVCYTYLSDVPPRTDIHEAKSPFRKSRWFERGWTLQELLAPSRLIFLYDDWTFLSERHEVVDLITQITGIDQIFLSTPPDANGSNRSRGSVLQSRLHSASIAEKMSWASKRETTRIEDTAYSLLGIFGINMPLLYGEGKNAFLRLQEEIMKRSDDQTLLAWSHQEDDPEDLGVLATSPAAFSECREFVACDVGTLTPPFQITNKGLVIEMPISSDGFQHGKYGVLQCGIRQDPTTMIAIPLDNRRNGLYVRRKKPLCTVNYRVWSEWGLTSVNLLPSLSFTSGIAESPSYTVFMKDLPETFYVAEVYPPDSRPRPDPKIVMAGTPDSKDQFEAMTMVLLKSSINEVEPLVVRIIVELAADESNFTASCTFVPDWSLFEREKDPTGRFYDNFSLANLWYYRNESGYMYWKETDAASYSARCHCVHRFGKTLVLASVTQDGIELKGNVPLYGPSMIFHDGDTDSDLGGNLSKLRKRWRHILRRLSHHCRSSSLAVLRSLTLSPWIFAFLVDQLIIKASQQIWRVMQHVYMHWKAYAVVSSIALPLRYKIAVQIKAITHAMPLARQFGWVNKANALDFFLLYISFKLLPSELLSAVVNKDYIASLDV
ncbi:heterokaryon incompatibility protein-domain-containing protein [Fusarium avenaceum]|nr:heterokaryon incompatibility protein-domain-containing protein [Fusarium avenaceum]